MTLSKFTGIVTPVLTPFNNDGSIAEDLYFEHCKHVLEEGATISHHSEHRARL